jgi:hypothetical protein
MVLQYAVVVSMIDLYSRSLPLGILAGIFVILSSAGIVIWHKKKSWQTVKQWRKLILLSLVLGVGYFAADVFLAYLHGNVNPIYSGGGVLGFPLTLAICPGFTMICVAGLVRTLYINRSTSARDIPSQEGC